MFSYFFAEICLDRIYWFWFIWFSLLGWLNRIARRMRNCLPSTCSSVLLRGDYIGPVTHMKAFCTFVILNAVQRALNGLWPLPSVCKSLGDYTNLSEVERVQLCWLPFIFLAGTLSRMIWQTSKSENKLICLTSPTYGGTCWCQWRRVNCNSAVKGEAESRATGSDVWLLSQRAAQRDCEQMQQDSVFFSFQRTSWSFEFTCV